MEKFNVICPCCESALTIDAQTGAVLAHEEKEKKLSSFEVNFQILNETKK